jgi:hypothetical protein
VDYKELEGNLRMNNNGLTDNDIKLIKSLKIQAEKFKLIIAVPMVLLVFGVVIFISSIMNSDEYYILMGLSLLTVCILVIGVSIRYKKIYLLMQKLLKDTELSD